MLCEAGVNFLTPWVPLGKREGRRREKFAPAELSIF